MSASDPSPASVHALERFVAGVPGTEAVLVEHRADYGEVLPHPLMAELRRRFVTAVEEGDQPFVSAFLAGIEDLLSDPSDDARNVADVSFVDDLVTGDERDHAAITAMRPLIGPATARSLRLSEEARC